MQQAITIILFATALIWGLVAVVKASSDESAAIELGLCALFMSIGGAYHLTHSSQPPASNRGVVGRTADAAPIDTQGGRTHKGVRA